MSAPNQKVENHHHGMPWKHIIGLILSLALTFLALWIVVSRAFSNTFTITAIVILAIFQALIQLFFFMHITESDSKWYQIGGIVVAFFIAIAVVAGSLWIMAYTM